LCSFFGIGSCPQETWSSLHLHTILFLKIHFGNVTDSINTLPVNSSVNTVQHATVDEAVFSMSSVPSSGEQGGCATHF
jgi:hypothetical protein